MSKAERIRTAILETDAEDVYAASIAAAVRWLARQSPDELTDDDSVGWWLLMQFGKHPSSEAMHGLSEKLKSLVSERLLKNGTLYTFTAVSRTLARSGYPLDEFPNLQKTWKVELERRVKDRRFDLNCIWLIQMAVELWPELARSKLSVLKSLTQVGDDKRLVPTMALLLLKDLGEEIDSQVRHNLDSWWSRLISSSDEKLNEFTDWNLAYAVRFLIACGRFGDALALGNLLCVHQKNGAWDKTSPECMESTGLCGLALLDMLAASIRRKYKDSSKAPSDAMCAVQALIDDYKWLCLTWSTTAKLPSSQVKGWALESFVEQWISFDKCVSNVKMDVRGGTDEIDAVVELLPNTPLSNFLSPSQFLLVECKNTTDSIGARDIRAFRDSLRSRRQSNFKLGIYVSSSGFTADAQRIVNEDFGKDQLLITMNGDEIDRYLRKRESFSSSVLEKLRQNVTARP